MSRQSFQPERGFNPGPVGVTRRPLEDLYHYLLTASWTQLLLIIVGVYFASNALFGLAYYADGGVAGARPESYSDSFFFSVQTMATIGYGAMSPTSFIAHALVSLEALFGLLGLATVTGLVFAKFSRPTARVRFSRYAIVAPRDGVPCLQFRAANYRANRIVEATMHVVLTRDEVTAEGATFRRFHYLSLIRDRNPRFSLSWTVLHPIDERSPLFGQTPESLAASRAEVLASMTGLDETFSQTILARHFYEPHEICWNHQFVDIFERQPDNRVRIDYSKFDDLVEIEAADRLRVAGK